MSLMNKSKLYPRSRKLLVTGVVLLLAVPTVTAMALAMRFDVDSIGAAVTQEQESKQKEKAKEKERVDRQSAEYLDGLRAGQKEAERRKQPFTNEDEARLARQMEELKAKGEALTNEDRARLARIKELLQVTAEAYAVEDEARLFRQIEEVKARDEMHASLVRLARIPMDQAIQIATSQFPGKVLQSSLGAKAGKSSANWLPMVSCFITSPSSAPKKALRP
jgi:uncharacterized protein YaaR (DUF327 family)